MIKNHFNFLIDYMLSNEIDSETLCDTKCVKKENFYDFHTSFSYL